LGAKKLGNSKLLSNGNLEGNKKPRSTVLLGDDVNIIKTNKLGNLEAP
jgi:hypothetical protein